MKITSIIFLLMFFVSPVAFWSQKVGVDTIQTENGKLVLYDNQTWDLAADVNFDGILNERIHKIVTSLNPPIEQKWITESCFTSRGNNLTSLKDTIWLCLNEFDEGHDFSIPLKNIVITSHYGPRKGRYHNGIDLALKTGDTVYSAFSGKVRYSKYNDGGFGNLVVVRHYNGLETFYAHLSKRLVMPNQEVKVGEPLGLGGTTGHSSGPHLHFEVRFYDGPINPEEIIDFEGKYLKRENLFVHRGLFRPGAKPSEFVEVLPAAEIAENLKDENADLSAIAAVIPKPVVNPVQKKYYQIKTGDTLSKIAAKYHTSVSQLCKLNGISSTSILKVGRSLRIK